MTPSLTRATANVRRIGAPYATSYGPGCVLHASVTYNTIAHTHTHIHTHGTVHCSRPTTCACGHNQHTQVLTFSSISTAQTVHAHTLIYRFPFKGGGLLLPTRSCRHRQQRSHKHSISRLQQIFAIARQQPINRQAATPLTKNTRSKCVCQPTSRRVVGRTMYIHVTTCTYT